MIIQNEENKSFILRKAEKYVKQMGIQMPVIVFNFQDMLTESGKRGYDEKKMKQNNGNGNQLWGLTAVKARGQDASEEDEVVLMVNFDTIRDYKLESKFPGGGVHTLIHELCHIRYPRLNHGRPFDNVINSVIMGKVFTNAGVKKARQVKERRRFKNLSDEELIDGLLKNGRGWNLASINRVFGISPKPDGTLNPFL